MKRGADILAAVALGATLGAVLLIAAVGFSGWAALQRIGR